MNKYPYIRPKIEIFNLQMKRPLLAISGDTENYDIHDEEVDAGEAL